VAQFNLAQMYETGEGVPQDHEEAAKWYRQAAQQENENALDNLVAMCNRGIAVAQFNLGGMYQDGLGVSQDDEEAVNWYRKAAEQGHKVAKLRLDKMKSK
jgi:TPR repeat protein